VLVGLETCFNCHVPPPLSPPPIQGEVLGNSLFYNKTLRWLNLRNNQITPRAAYTIAMAVRHKQQLDYLNLLENPIGYAGGRAAMGIVLDMGHRLEVKLGWVRRWW